MKQYYVYILASQRNGTLYIGVSSDLLKRVLRHRSEEISGFTKRYGVHALVYYEVTENIHSAIQREKQMKKWNREWKLRVIEETNPGWKDLSNNLM